MAPRKKPFAPARCLDTALRNTDLRHDADDIFFRCPDLRQVALRYVEFVSPFIVQEGENLLEASLQDAITAFRREEPADLKSAWRAYIEAFVFRVGTLCRLRMSVQDRDGHWAIWNYDQPLLAWMAIHGRRTLQIRVREQSIEPGPLVVKLLSHICDVRQLQSAGVDLARLV